MTSADSTRTGRTGEVVVAARRFTDASPGAGLAGALSIGGRVVRFEAGDEVVELPVLGLVARVSGFDDRTLFLSHPSRPGLELATADPRAVSAPVIAGLPSMSAGLVHRRARRRRFWGCLLGVLLAALLGLVALALAADWLMMALGRLIGH